MILIKVLKDAEKSRQVLLSDMDDLALMEADELNMNVISSVGLLKDFCNLQLQSAERWLKNGKRKSRPKSKI